MELEAAEAFLPPVLSEIGEMMGLLGPFLASLYCNGSWIGPTCTSLTDVWFGRDPRGRLIELRCRFEQMMNLRLAVRWLSEKKADQAAVPLGSRQSVNR